MSEKAPNPFQQQLDEFDRNREVHHAKEWMDEIQGEAGKTDFSDEAKKRLEEAAEYYDHMGGFAEDERSAYDRNLDRLDDSVESDAVRREGEALERAFENDPKLRRMDYLSREIDRMRKMSDEDKAKERDPERLKNYEDRLQEMLEEYSRSESYNPAIADLLMDRDDAQAWLDAGVNAILAERGHKHEKATDDKKSDDKDEVEKLKESGKLDTEATDGDDELEKLKASGKLDVDDKPADPADTRELPKVETSRRRRLLDRAGSFFKNTKERLRTNKKKTALGALAVVLVGGGLATWKFGGLEYAKSLLDHFGDPNNADAANTSRGTTGGAFEGNPPTPPVETFSDAARSVESGEGWYQTMREIGVTDPQIQQDLLHNDTVMERLEDMGLAYRAPELGGWGINMTEDGKMPAEALSILKEAAQSARDAANR